MDENGEIVDVAPENIEEYARISSQATVPELDPNESYPSVVMSFAPIFVPVILILASTFTSMMYKGDPTPVTEIIGFLGSPVIAISISLLVSIYGLAGNKSRQEVLDASSAVLRAAVPSSSSPAQAAHSATSSSPAASATSSQTASPAPICLSCFSPS